MNYWLADPANLAECVEPLIAMVEDLTVTGAEMAKAHYGARGWVLHHNTDLWRATGPIDGAKWGLWPTGGAWLCAQLWDHVAFAGDDALVAPALSAARRARRSSSSICWCRCRARIGWSPARRSRPRTSTPKARRCGWARRWTTRSCAICSTR